MTINATEEFMTRLTSAGKELAELMADGSRSEGDEEIHNATVTLLAELGIEVEYEED